MLDALLLTVTVMTKYDNFGRALKLMLANLYRLHALQGTVAVALAVAAAAPHAAAADGQLAAPAVARQRQQR